MNKKLLGQYTLYELHEHCNRQSSCNNCDVYDSNNDSCKIRYYENHIDDDLIINEGSNNRCSAFYVCESDRKCEDCDGM